jgi:hypothetical protein
MCIGLYIKYPLFWSDFNENLFSRQIFWKSSNIEFHENPWNVSRVVACEKRDTTNLILAFRNFANAPQNVTLGNTVVAVSQAVVSSYFWIHLLNILHKTRPLSLRCRPYAVLQSRRKTFHKFLADNEVACYGLPYLGRNRRDPCASV